MYLQYRNNRGTYELILANNRPDSDNEAILRGDYLDKTPTYDDEGHEIPFEMPSREQLLKECIFPDWQEGDILVVAPEPLKHPKWSDELQTLVEMTKEEVCSSGDLTVLGIGEKFQDGHIVQVPNTSTEYLRYTWDRETFTWKLITTREELQQAKTNLILQHNKKRKEISALNEESEYFDVSESVAKANDELEEIRAKINEIDKVIEEMNKQQEVII